MIMMRLYSLTLALALTAFLVATTSFAVPSLQLGFWDPVAQQYVGTYDPVTQTTIAPGQQFMLRALLNGPDTLLGSDYYISAALLTNDNNSPPDVAQDLGSFNFAGTDVIVTADMFFGIPPANAVSDSKTLPTHSVFPTFYREFVFQFGSATTPAIDMETLQLTGGDPLYFADFGVDISNLTQGYAIHFDLYNERFHDATEKNPIGYYEVDDFAPFSHDAQGNTLVPEPSTWALMGFGATCLLAATARNRRMR
jgi:hypothetical protein